MDNGPGRPEVGPATNIRLGEQRTTRIDATRVPGQARADAVRHLIDRALYALDLATQPYSTAYGIGMIHGARAALQILEECGPKEIAAYVRGDKPWPEEDLGEDSIYTYVDLARDLGREISWNDVDFTEDGDSWLKRVGDAYSEGRTHVLCGIIRATYWRYPDLDMTTRAERAAAIPWSLAETSEVGE